jgi:putative NADPH-quinone reductase
LIPINGDDAGLSYPRREHIEECMTKRIAIIQGHPDDAEARFCRAFAKIYAESARAAGHTVDVIDVAGLAFPLLRSKAGYERGEVPLVLEPAQEAIRNADHLLLIFPLWLGDLPALLKGFLEQILRPGFAYAGGMDGGKFRPLLKGKSARVVVTMGMPAIAYRLFFGAHGLKNLRRNILGFCGVGPIRESLIGLIEQHDPKARETWLARASILGREGA